MARRRKDVVNKMDMSLDDIIALNKRARGGGARGGRGRGRGGGTGLATGQTRPWIRQTQATAKQQRVQQIQRRARMTVLRKRLIQRPKPVVASSSGSTGAGMMSSLRGRGRGRGRGWVRGRGRGRGLVSQTRATAEEEVAEPAAVGRGRARGRGTVGRGRGTRGRGIGRGRVAMATGPGSSPASRPGSRLKIIRGLKGRGKAVIAIKRRLSTGSLQQMATPTRGRGMSRGRGRGRGSLSAGSTPVAGPSGATPLRVSIVEEQKLEPVGVNLSPDFAATHHTKKSLNTRFSQSQRSHVQRLVMTDGRNVQYS